MPLWDSELISNLNLLRIKRQPTGHFHRRVLLGAGGNTQCLALQFLRVVSILLRRDMQLTLSPSVCGDGRASEPTSSLTEEKPKGPRAKGLACGHGCFKG